MKASPKRMEAARLSADMSRADLAAALRRVTSGRLKASERGIRGWERGEYAPSDGVIPAYAIATGKPLDFFYADESGGADSDLEEEDLSAPLSRAIENIVKAAVAQAVKA